MLTKPRTPSKGSQMSMYSSRKRKVSPLMIIGISVPVLLALIGVGVLVVLPQFQSHAATATPNPNCNLIIPANALTAQGLATPYQLVAPDAAQNGACNEANAAQGAFVQGVVYNPATGALSVYSPLIIDKGTQPAVVPTVPTLPANAVVGLWFGFNGTNLTLQGAQGDNTLAQAQCVNGLNGSVFGQFAYCNAPNFFSAVKNGIANGLVKVPALGMANDGKTCMSARDFGLVDMDQSDNVQTRYLANANGQTAQVTAANLANLANATQLGNPSDNALLTNFVDPALGCTPWTVTNLADPAGAPVPAMALDEIQAATFQQAPVALVPISDPMTLVNGNQSQDKTILYRKGVFQKAGGILPADAVTYCNNLLKIGLPRIQGDMNITAAKTSPDPNAANSLFTFLATRFMQGFGANGLNCIGLLNIQNPVAVQTDANGVTIAATITLAGANTVTQAATGTATITLNANGNSANVAVKATYPNHANQQVNVNIVTGNCSGTAVLTQPENTDGAGAINADTVINNLNGLTAIPANWFFTINDPMLGTTVACGAVTANGVMGTATLGTGAVIAPAAPAAAAGAPAANAPAANAPAAAAPAANVKHKKGKHAKW